MKAIVTVIFVLFLTSCNPSQKQHIEFKGFTIENGVYKAKDGWHFQSQEDGTFIAMKADDSNGGQIEPCDCSLSTGGSCSQASSEDDFGNITDIWCVDDGCGFCVGGITEEPGIGEVATRIEIRLENNQKVKGN